jgi:hypothetical protein
MAIFAEDQSGREGVLQHTDVSNLRYSEVLAMKDCFAFDYDTATGKATAGYLEYSTIAITDENATGPTVPKAIGFAAGDMEASLLDVALLAPQAGDPDEDAGDAPLMDEWVGENSDETDASKIARIGTSGYAARADHIHPICAEMGPSGGVDKSMQPTDGDFGATGAPTGVVLDQSTWTPGTDGYIESYCTRIQSSSDGLIKYVIFRKRKISRTGSVVYVGPEYVGFTLAG